MRLSFTIAATVSEQIFTAYSSTQAVGWCFKFKCIIAKLS